MRIHVLGEDSISPQARAYAEYRVFAALAHSAARVRNARVVLRSQDDGGCARVACAVTINREGTASLRVRATGAHAYAAINRAVERVRMATESAIAERIPS
jgi:ribosome-associated translation inhibitor RaiA